ncbi:tetratricopeptide repeat protein [Mangrovimonas sp. CR14]|uniref:tetratricopeptide repeat protein n=1 Tax=Mangrovimonas sp. CR14 TaxID=2706120 RepID=UPI001422F4C5|nr:tetratricopeptide repeat protein [Mangrovimonas sp. CR14]NIK91230.1 tetratricopeptide repeat protein [Mangrovimonas sp. CR14]
MWRLGIIFIFPIGLLSQTLDDEVKSILMNNQFADVESYMEMKLEANPNDLETVELLGDIYSHQEMWDEAVEQYDILKSKHPDNANYQYKYGGALGMKAASNKLAGIGLISDVKASLLKAAELDPRHIDVRWALVKFYMELPAILGGSTDKSLEFANQLETLSPVDGHLAKGFIFKENEDYIQAETYLKKALEIGGSKTCYLELAQLYMETNQKEKAKQVLKQGVEAIQDDDLRNKLQELSGE